MNPLSPPAVPNAPNAPNAPFAPIRQALLLAASLLALTACGGGGDDGVDTSAEPLMAVPVHTDYQALALDYSATRQHPDLVLNTRGQLLHTDGSRVFAWPDNPADDITAAPDVPLRLANAVTHWLRPEVNFDSRQAPVPDDQPLDPNDNTTSHASVTYRVWLPDGQPRDLRLLFRAACVPAASWDSFVPSPEKRSPCLDTGVTVNAVLNDRLLGPRLALGFAPDGSSVSNDKPLLTLTAEQTGLPQDIVVDFRLATHYGSWFGLADLHTDGHGAGRLIEAWVDTSGQLQLRYDNGVQTNGPLLVLNGVVRGRL